MPSLQTSIPRSPPCGVRLASIATICLRPTASCSDRSSPGANVQPQLHPAACFLPGGRLARSPVVPPDVMLVRPPPGLAARGLGTQATPGCVNRALSEERDCRLALEDAAHFPNRHWNALDPVGKSRVSGAYDETTDGHSGSRDQLHHCSHMYQIRRAGFGIDMVRPSRSRWIHTISFSAPLTKPE